MEQFSVDQNEFLKDVRERAKVLSKNARQTPEDSADKLSKFEEEDQETKDYLAIIRGNDQTSTDDKSQHQDDDSFDLDFASNLAANRQLDFSRERFKVGLAQRRVQKRRRPQSWAWTATSDNSAVQIKEIEGPSEIALSVQIRMDENDKADDSPKKTRPQNRFSSPVFNEKLLSDLGNVLKKKKSPTNAGKESKRERTPSPLLSKKLIVTPASLQGTSPNLSPRSISPSPIQQQHLTTTRTPSPEDVSLVLVTEKEVFGSKMSPFLMRRSTGSISKKSKETDSEQTTISDDDVEMSSSPSLPSNAASTSDVISAPSAPLSSNTIKVQSGYINEYVKLNVGPKAPLPKPKPKPKSQQSSAMLLKSAAESNLSKVAKEDSRDVVKPKPSWLEELEKKKSKDPIKADSLEGTDLSMKSSDMDSSGTSTLPAWMQKEVSTRQKRLEASNLVDTSSVNKVPNIEKKPHFEDPQPPSWLQELNLKKQKKGLRKEASPIVNESSEIKGNFDYRSHEELKKAEIKDESKPIDEDDQTVKSVSELKKKLKMKSTVDKNLNKKASANVDLKSDSVDGLVSNKKLENLAASSSEMEGENSGVEYEGNLSSDLHSSVAKSCKSDYCDVEDMQRKSETVPEPDNLRDQICESKLTESVVINDNHEMILQQDSKEVSKQDQEPMDTEMELIVANDDVMEGSNNKRTDISTESMEVPLLETSASASTGSNDSSILKESGAGVLKRKSNQLEGESKGEVGTSETKEDPAFNFEEGEHKEIKAETSSDPCQCTGKLSKDKSDENKPETVLVESALHSFSSVGATSNNKQDDVMDNSQAIRAAKVTELPVASKDNPILKAKEVPKVPFRPKVLPRPKPKLFVEKETVKQEPKLKISQPPSFLQQKALKSLATGSDAAIKTQENLSHSYDQLPEIKSLVTDAAKHKDNRDQIDVSGSVCTAAESSSGENSLSSEYVNTSSDNKEEKNALESAMALDTQALQETGQVDAKRAFDNIIVINGQKDNVPEKSEIKQGAGTDDDKLPKRLRGKIVRVNSFEHGVLSRPVVDSKKGESSVDKFCDKETHKDLSSADAELVSQPKSNQVSSPDMNKITKVVKSDSFKENDDVNNQKMTDKSVTKIVQEKSSKALDDTAKDTSMKNAKPEKEDKITVKEPKEMLFKSIRPPPPKPKPKPKLPVRTEALKEKKTETVKDSSAFTEKENLRNIEKSKYVSETDSVKSEPTLAQTENKELAQLRGSQFEKVTMRAKNPAKIGQRRPVSMIESISSSAKNEGTDKGLGSGTKFAVALEKKQKSCWFRGAFDTNDLKPVDEYDDIPAWKKQLLARLKSSDNKNEKKSNEKVAATEENTKESTSFRSRLVTSPDLLSKKPTSFGMKEPITENDTSKSDESEIHSIPSFIREFAARKQSRGQKGVGNIDEKQTSTTVSDVKEINTDNEAWV
ncbi:uncharacterized protein LOC135683032 [Rhopilema esculentum]|uniref:uncharacterized protein LOC135683032 n=1 Tax=Rhopilema esculentum TaxID=499914 RepID=UPI0031CE5610